MSSTGVVAVPERTRKNDYHPGFRPDVEGLRAVAVLTVLAFHAAVPHLQGGYVGVDVFFVISGFLITGQLLAGVARDGRFSLAEFYARRARRILPAAGVVLAVTAAASALLLPPMRLKDVADDLLAAAANLANWRFIDQQTDYLLGSRDPSPVLHYWSLAVEEQFYLVWAPLLLVTALAARRLGRSPIAAVGVVVTVVTVASLWLCVRWTAQEAPLAYLSSPTRAWQFGLGALVALGAPYTGRLPRAVRYALLCAGGLAIGGSTVVYDAATRFPGWPATVPTLGAALVILTGTGMKPGTAWGGPLRLPAVRAIGRLSFAWYLWHWPVLVLAEAGPGPLAWPWKLCAVALSALPAMLTLRLVERPLRFSVAVSARPRRGLSLGAGAAILPVIAALLVGSAATRTLGEPPAVIRIPPGATAGGGFALASTTTLVPHPLQARRDYPQDWGCEVALTATTSPPCRFGTGRRRMVLLGDSHAGQWFGALLPIAQRRGWTLEVLVKPGCPLADITVVDPRLGRRYDECGRWREYALRRLAGGPRPELVVVSSLGFYQGDLRAGWARTLDRLRPIAPVAYLRDTPSPGLDVPSCLSGAPRHWGRCSFPRDRTLPADPLAGRTDVTTVDLTATICPGTTCPAVRDGVVLYRDPSHLTNTAATVLSARLERSLENARLVPPVWRRVLGDDFDGAAGTAPSPRLWTYDLGTCYPGCPAPRWGTGEIETMTSARANVALDGHGNLAITPRRDARGRWTSARLTSARADLAPPPGGTLRVAAKIRLPDVGRRDGAGYWPAFWMLGGPFRRSYTDWPAAGEVDIMEAVNGRPETAATLHCGTLPAGPCREDRGGLGSGLVPHSPGFHEYAVEIDHSSAPEEIRWYVDDRMIHRVTATQMDPATWTKATHNGFFLILDVAIGGTMPGPPTTRTTPDHPMLIANLTATTRG